MDFARIFVAGPSAKESLLPSIYDYWLRAYSLKGGCDAVPLSEEALPRFLADIKQRSFCGGNIIRPYKEAALAMIEKPQEAAKKLGAVNIVWLENDVLCGTNSDAASFLENMDAAKKGWEGDKAVILGTGYPARIIIHALFERGFQSVFVASRAKEQAEILLQAFAPSDRAKIKIGDVEDVNIHLPGAKLVVHAGVLGTAPGAPSDKTAAEAVKPFNFLDFHALPRDAVAADITYKPLQTAFLQTAQAAGLEIVDGLGMLFYQAASGFTLWFGQKPQPDKKLREFIVAKMDKQEAEAGKQE